MQAGVFFREDVRALYRRERPALRSLLLWCVAAVPGVAGVLSGDASSRVAGWVLLLASGGGLLACLSRWLQWWRFARWGVEQERLRSRKRALRRERDAARRARQQAARAARVRVEGRALEARAAARSAVRAREQADRERGRARAAALEAEVARLCALPDAAFAREVQEIFVRRGYVVRPVGVCGSAEFLLYAPGQFRPDVVCVLPGGHAGTVDAGNALEAWRAECGAGCAFLVSRDGFAWELADLAGRRALTLVEPYLLASWQLSGFSSEADGE